MFSTANQQEFKQELDTVFKDNGGSFTSGYVNSLAVEMLNLLPKRKQREFIAQVARFNGQHKITVKSLMSGQDVEISRSERGGPCDPSTERYWTM